MLMSDLNWKEDYSIAECARGYEILDGFYSDGSAEAECTILRIIVEKQSSYYCYVPTNEFLMPTNSLMLFKKNELQTLKKCGLMGIQITTNKEYMEVDYLFPKSQNFYLYL